MKRVAGTQDDGHKAITAYKDIAFGISVHIDAKGQNGDQIKNVKETFKDSLHNDLLNDKITQRCVKLYTHYRVKKTACKAKIEWGDSMATNRQSKNYKRIIQATVTCLKRKHARDLSLEEVAKTAGVTRKTVYNHFENKEVLLEVVVTPILTYCLTEAEKIAAQDTVEFKEIAAFCYALYDVFGDDLVVIYQVPIEELGEAFKLHRAYTQTFIELFSKVEVFKGRKLSQRELAYMVFKLFLPLLEVVKNRPDSPLLFENALRGLVEGALQ